MAADPKYVAAWQRYRTWARLRWIALLGYLPFAAVVLAVGGTRMTPLIICAWLPFVALTLIKAGTLPCPRCDRPFRSFWRMTDPFVMRCAHCELPKWADHDPNSDVPARPRR